MDYFLIQTMNGLVIGLIYGLVAAGLTLIFSILKIVNFAHGELYMMGGYAGYYLLALTGAPPVFAIPGAMVGGFVLGAAFERLFLTPLYSDTTERKDEYALIVTFGLAIFLRNLALVIFGPFNKRPESVWSGVQNFGGLILTNDRLIAAAGAILLLGSLLYFMRRTMLGQALDAVSQNRDAAAIVGIDPRRFYTLAYGLGGLLAGAAGALIAPIFTLSPAMGVLPAIKAFVIVVLGGMGSVVGSIVGGIFIGVGESLGVAFFPDPSRALAYANAFGLIILALTLIFRPTGLFGRRHLRLE